LVAQDPEGAESDQARYLVWTMGAKERLQAEDGLEQVVGEEELVGEKYTKPC
jgi:hypothetical protein